MIASICGTVCDLVGTQTVVAQSQGAFFWGWVPRAPIFLPLVFHVGSVGFQIIRVGSTDGALVGARPRAESFVDSLMYC